MDLFDLPEVISSLGLDDTLRNRKTKKSTD